MKKELARLVRERSAGVCEYCRLPESATVAPFEIDHVIARKHAGPTTDDNLALSCFYCNSAKGPNIAGLDPESGTVVRLFHPRRDTWADHFRWSGDELLGLTPVGRATVAVLQMNQPDLLILRRLLRQEGSMP